MCWNGSSPTPVTRVSQQESGHTVDLSKVESNNKTEINQVSKKVRDEDYTISETNKDSHGTPDSGDPPEKPAGLKPKQKLRSLMM